MCRFQKFQKFWGLPLDFRDKLILALLKENVQFWEEFTCNTLWLNDEYIAARVLNLEFSSATLVHFQVWNTKNYGIAIFGTNMVLGVARYNTCSKNLFSSKMPNSTYLWSPMVNLKIFHNFEIYSSNINCFCQN